MVEIKELVVKTNEQCERIKDYITENEGMFDSMDLKLHDASFYEYRDMEKEKVQLHNHHLQQVFDLIPYNITYLNISFTRFCTSL